MIQSTKGSLFLLKVSEVRFKLRICSDSGRVLKFTSISSSSELSAERLALGFY
jgi:hypothetical protein